MLWFFIVLCITVLCIIWEIIYSHFDLYNYEFLSFLSWVIGIFGAIALLIMACIAISVNTDTDFYIASMQQRYEIIVYQLENNVYDNDNDIGKRELYEQIRNWNEDLAKRKELQDSKWVGMFYADIYDQFEFIPFG